jgi:hypothetical protein
VGERVAAHARGFGMLALEREDRGFTIAASTVCASWQIVAALSDDDVAARPTVAIG